MALIEKGTCLIDFVNEQGLGCGQTNFGSVEVPYTLPGEIVSFERHEYRSQSNCLLKTIEKQSSGRITPECKYFGRCGGCTLQHMDIETYNNFKYNLVKNALPDEVLVKPIITIDKGNRRRINLKAFKREEKLLLGFYRFHSHQIIDIDSCLAAMKPMSDILVPLKETLTLILKNRQKAEIFLTHASNGIDMLLEINDIIELEVEQELKDFALKNGIIRLQISLPKKSMIIFESESPYIILAGKKVAIDAKCFIQASFSSDQILAELVAQYLPAEKGELVDLFCGRGTFSLPLSKRFSVYGFDSDAASLEALEKVSKGEIFLQERNLFTNPLNADELRSYRFAVINPPRAGALAQVKELSNSNCARIIYVSCNPETFARDAKILERGGYKLLEATPVDQFYWSSHVEVVGVFARNIIFVPNNP